MLAGIVGRRRRREPVDRAATPARHQRARELRPSAGDGRGRARNRRPRQCPQRLRRRERRARRSLGWRARRARSLVALDQHGRGASAAAARSTSPCARHVHKHGVPPSGCTRSTISQQREYVAELDELVSVLAYLITRPPIPVAVFAFFSAFPRTARSVAGHRGSARHAMSDEATSGAAERAVGAEARRSRCGVRLQAGSFVEGLGEHVEESPERSEVAVGRRGQASSTRWLRGM